MSIMCPTGDARGHHDLHRTFRSSLSDTNTRLTFKNKESVTEPVSQPVTRGQRSLAFSPPMLMFSSQDRTIQDGALAGGKGGLGLTPACHLKKDQTSSKRTCPNGVIRLTKRSNPVSSTSTSVSQTCPKPGFSLDVKS